MAKTRLIAVAILIAVVFAGGLFLGFKIPAWVGWGGGVKIYGTSALLQRVQTLSQLVTVKYVIEKAVVVEDVKWYGENRVLLLAQGIVKAGVDLSQVKPEDIEISGRRLTLRLPRAQVTDVYLDETQTRVVERETGLLRAFDKDLEQSARQTALDDIGRAARRSGILKDAEERARTQLAEWLRGMGFEEVSFAGAAANP
jgi:hypothetical protein